MNSEYAEYMPSWTLIDKAVWLFWRSNLISTSIRSYESTVTYTKKFDEKFVTLEFIHHKGIRL